MFSCALSASSLPYLSFDRKLVSGEHALLNGKEDEATKHERRHNVHDEYGKELHVMHQSLIL